jgi:hypothetical protein
MSASLDQAGPFFGIQAVAADFISCDSSGDSFTLAAFPDLDWAVAKDG